MSGKISTKMEYRASLRAAAKDDAFELHGTAVSYNVLSQDLGGFRERIAPGCFTRALAANPDVKMLLNHDANHVLGRTTNGTLTLLDTPQGLNFICRLDPNQQAHRDLHSSIKRQDISQCSFAFKPTADGDEWAEARDEKGAWFNQRTVKQANIFDCSVVSAPAYNAPGATSVVARSAGPIQQVSMEELYRRKYGREFVSDQDLAMRAHHLGLKIKADAHRHFRELVDDAKLRLHAEELGRRIRVEALLEEMKGLVN